MSLDNISNLSDEEIITLYQNGEIEAFKALIERYSPILHNFVSRIAGYGNATDIVQETFIKAWRNLPRFDSQKASFKTWIFTICRNTSTDFLRKKKSILFSDIESGKEDEESFATNIPDEALLPDEALDKLQNREILNQTLEKLRPSYREILILHYQEELTFEEIGKVLNKPLNTVKSQHRRAIIELQEKLR